MSAQRFTAWLVVAAVFLAGGFYARGVLNTADSDERSDAGRPKLDFIVAGPDAFYQIVVAGARAAADDFEADLEVHVPSGTPEGQTAVLAAIAARGSDGVAISPLAPAEQSQVLSKLATQAHVVTYDNDAPQSLRHCYVGTNNYEAGSLCADAVKAAMPDGATIVVFIGDAERENAIQRRRGLIDGILGSRSNEEETYPLKEPVEAGGYRVVATYTDNQDADQAVANAATALEEHPELDCMVGLYGYNGPSCLKVARDQGKLADVTLVTFDEHKETLEGLDAGEVAATILQDPYQYGYESVRLLSSLHKRVDNAVPLAGRGSIYLPCKKLEQGDVGEYRARLKARMGAAEPLTPSAPAAG